MKNNWLCVGFAFLFLGGVCVSGSFADDLSQVEQASTESETEAELKEMKAELERLTTEYKLMLQRQKNELLEAELREKELESRTSLRKAMESEGIAELQSEVAKLKAEASLAEARFEASLAEQEREIKRRSTQEKLADLEINEQLKRLEIEKKRLALENAVKQEELKKAQAELALAKQSAEQELSMLQSKLELRSKKDTVADRVIDDIQYRRDPFVDGTLYVSDRRIALNGPITYGTADYVTERIHYFNNQDRELPIFIMIDVCPGGSVMEGYRILKAMESSPAPVHVVVKQFAASMAALITTLSDHSYAYPNAVILHHQMSSGTRGNMTQQREQLEAAEEWARRLMVPLSEKMGMTPERVVELMYENNSDGDWEEFADRAVELNWVQHIVDEVREDGIRTEPTSTRWSLPFFFEAERTDEQGRKFIELPRLYPFDAYFIYNADGYYRVAR